MSDLLPCPFCGASAQISTRTDECIWSHDQVEWTAVSCSGGPDFDCFQPSVDWPTSATDDHGTQLSISQWNRRAIPAADARAEVLKEAATAIWNGPITEYGRAAQGPELQAANKCRDAILALIPEKQQ